MASAQAIRIVLVTVFVGACVQPSANSTVPTGEDEAAIARMTKGIADAAAAGDVEKLLTYYSDDYIKMAPDAPTAVGKPDLRTTISALLDQNTISHTITFSDLHVIGAWAAGTYAYTFDVTPKGGGDTVAEAGKGVAFLQRSPAGEWQLSQAVWNRNAPAPALPPETRN